jgi:uncharacterized protein (DUF2267 family)
MNSITNLEKYLAEGNRFIRELARELEHPEELDQTERILRSVLHVLRDKISTAESFHLMSQLPAYLKLLYIEGWKYREKPLRIHSIEEFKEEIKNEQYRLGERSFAWKMPTEQIISRVITSLRKYVSDGEFRDMLSNLPEEVHPLFGTY